MLTPPPTWPALSDMEDCEARWQMTLLEPPKEKPPSWLGEDTQLPTVRTNLVVIKQPIDKQTGTAQDPVDMAKELLEESKGIFARMEVERDVIDFSFDDEAVGATVDVSFDAPHNARLTQRHVFRRDGDIQVHFVVTKEMNAPDDHFDAFVSTIRAYLPD
jgi:hypothetical protein